MGMAWEIDVMKFFSGHTIHTWLTMNEYTGKLRFARGTPVLHSDSLTRPPAQVGWRALFDGSFHFHAELIINEDLNVLIVRLPDQDGTLKPRKLRLAVCL
jgi:hypothetical protein